MLEQHCCASIIMPTKSWPKSANGWRSDYGFFADGSHSGPFTNQYSASWSNTFTGVSNPNYRQQIRAGSSATTPANGIKASIHYGHGMAQLTYESPVTPGGKDKRLTDGFMLSSPVFSNNSSLYNATNADKTARLKWLAKYREARTTFQGGTFFGELGETIRMLSSPAKALRQGITNYALSAKKRAGLGKTLKQANRAVAETWLEYSYGFRPLVSDIQDAAKLLNSQPDRYRIPITATATEDVSVERIKDIYQNGHLRYITLLSRTGSVSVRYKGAVDAGFNHAPSFAEQTGFNLSNFAPTVWNLIPYSFLVDYFTNIGKMIDGASLGTVSLAWGCLTTRKNSRVNVEHCDIDWDYVKNNNLKNASGHASAQFSAEHTDFSRQNVPSISVSLMDFQFRVPGVESTKWLNIAALASLRSVPSHFFK